MDNMNNKFSSLTLHELQQYVLNLESENEKLINKLRISSKLIYVLQNIAKSCQMCYSLLRKIEINKCCDCNDHLNETIRKSLIHSIDESNIWLDEYQSIAKDYDICTDTENEQRVGICDTSTTNSFDLQKSSKYFEYMNKSSNSQQQQLVSTKLQSIDTICNSFNSESFRYSSLCSTRESSAISQNESYEKNGTDSNIVEQNFGNKKETSSLNYNHTEGSTNSFQIYSETKLCNKIDSQMIYKCKECDIDFENQITSRAAHYKDSF
jgi:hypothetical protein